MKTIFTILLLFLGSNCCLAQQKFEVITSDVDLFWQAFDQLSTATSAADSVQILETHYISKGSDGVRQFTAYRIRNAKNLQETISRHKAYYTFLRQHTPKLQKAVPRMHRHYKKLRRLYPETHIPRVYFVIGALNSAGTIEQDPVVGVDMFGYYPGTPKTELSSWLRSVLQPIEQIDVVVFHEIVHKLQKGYPNQEQTLLKRSITEGAADFIGELVTGSNINKHVHAYANERERELWLAFEQEMHGTDVSNWLYNGMSSKDKPADLGYYMGYKICEAYYNKVKNKKQAIKEILDIKDYKAFLEKSGYARKFSTSLGQR